jgi:RNA polymerase sigma-70 factor (ECF subfamily)
LNAHPETNMAVGAVFREEAGHVVSSLARALGDFALAEESVQDALLAALEHWQAEGIPRRPGAWLLTVARRLALNRLARASRYRTKITELAELDDLPHEPDDRLRLIFTCCHPALARDAQVALTLRAVCGFTTPEIAHAFVAREATVAQRIVRAQRKIVDAGIRYKLPDEDERTDRVREVLAVLYLMFNEGYLSSGGAAPTRRDLAKDAAWLTALLADLMPGEPEAIGLLALMKLHLARTDARFDTNGDLVVLSHQDRSRWDCELIAEAVSHLERAALMRRVGPCQIEAAIAACHAEASSFEATDWAQILILYDLLSAIAPSPVVVLNRSVALHHVEGPKAALAEVEKLEDSLDGYHLFHAIRGELLIELGRTDLAKAARSRALNLTENCAEQALLRRRLFG